MIIGGFVFFGLLMGVRMHLVLEDTMDDSSLQVSVESDEVSKILVLYAIFKILAIPPFMLYYY